MRLKITVRVKFPACPSSIFSFGGEGKKWPISFSPANNFSHMPSIAKAISETVAVL